MAIKVYNTLTRRKQEFVPRDQGKIAMYVCGPTVYNYIHIGNARCYVAFDAIVRYLQHSGFSVTYVRNLTDVDDKIIKRAQEEGTTASEIANKYTKVFHQDMEVLGCLEPNIEPKATETIDGMIKVIEGLVEKGFAYVVDDDVFFEIAKFKDYGKLSHRTLDEMRAGERVEVDVRKHHPMDFALWKKAKPGEPSWPSPWGEGRPGWHIECSTMSVEHLGIGFDIHGGGQDLIFPHHENEIAQAEAYTGKELFVRYWLHNGFVTIRAEKMAKSVGNVVLIHDLCAQHKGREIDLRNALRMLFLSTHYRSPIDYSEEHLEEAKTKAKGLVNVLWQIDDLLEKRDLFSKSAETNGSEKVFAEKIEDAKDKFEQAMSDDFNTPAAIGALFELEKAANIFINQHKSGFSFSDKSLLEKARDVIKELSGDVLGIVLGGTLSSGKEATTRIASALLTVRIAKIPSDQRALLEKELANSSVDASTLEKDLVDLLVKKREEARKNKDFQSADKIRAKLAEAGVIIEDTPHGARWKWK